MNIYSKLNDVIKYRANSIALIDAGKKLTYNELGENVDRCAAYFRSKGVDESSKVAIAIYNSVEFVIAFMSLAKLNATVLLINPNFTSVEIKGVYDGYPFDFAIAEKEIADLFSESVGCDLIISKDLLSTIEKFERDIFSVDLKTDHILTYQTSSGTTGLPKGVLRTEKQILSEADNVISTTAINDRDIVLLPCPAYHEYGFIAGIITPLLTGASIILVKKFIPMEVLNLISKHNVTILVAVPFMYNILNRTSVNKTHIDVFKTVKYFYSSGDKLPGVVAQDFNKKFGNVLRQFYGLTETGVVAINTENRNSIKYDSVGKPINNVIVDIVDDELNVLERNKHGEIRIKSNSIFKCYNHAANNLGGDLQHGYFLTGDLGYIDDQGYLFIVGRKKDIIITAGINVNPDEVENILRKHQSVKDAAVYGVEDALIGQYIEASVVIQDDVNVDMLMEICRKNLAHFKIPRVIKVVDVIPRTTSGKVKRFLLRKK